jgi:hypothetical protein
MSLTGLPFPRVAVEKRRVRRGVLRGADDVKLEPPKMTGADP